MKKFLLIALFSLSLSAQTVEYDWSRATLPNDAQVGDTAFIDGERYLLWLDGWHKWEYGTEGPDLKNYRCWVKHKKIEKPGVKLLACDCISQ